MFELQLCPSKSLSLSSREREREKWRRTDSRGELSRQCVVQCSTLARTEPIFLSFSNEVQESLDFLPSVDVSPRLMEDAEAKQLESIHTKMYPMATAPYCTYARVHWTLQIRKEVGKIATVRRRSRTCGEKNGAFLFSGLLTSRAAFESSGATFDLLSNSKRRLFEDLHPDHFGKSSKNKAYAR